MILNNLNINTNQAENILFKLFGIKGNADALPGELDHNFKITVQNKNTYILKVSRPGENENHLKFQQLLLEHLAIHNKDLKAPKIIYDKKGKAISETEDEAGQLRKVRLLTWIPGRLWSHVNPQLNELGYSLGRQCASITQALQGFDHLEAHRNFDWDVAQALWTNKHLSLFHEEEKEVIAYFQKRFEMNYESYAQLRKGVVHNDANDNNILVSSNLINPEVIAVIDFGDAIFTQIINDVAIACAYAIMIHNDPLEATLPILKGYHSTFPLQENELEHLYNVIAMRLVISVTKSAINKVKEPNNTYLQISEEPALELLNKWKNISPDFAHFNFRFACGFVPHNNQLKFLNWATKSDFKISGLFPSINKNKVHKIDLSVSSKWLGHEQDFNDLELFQFKINRLQSQHPNKIIAGGYLEPRPLYTSTDYDKTGNNGKESRTIHLGVDFWLQANTPVHALFDGTVVTAVNDEGEKEYGGLIILKHTIDDFECFTLYGHLSLESITKLQIGDSIKKGSKIGELGNYHENGNWVPHLHFQIMLSMLDYKIDFPGVAYHNQIDVWKSICPDPNALFKLKTLKKTSSVTDKDLVNFRKRHLGKSLSLQYKDPVRIVRGAGVYLMDQFGKKYLDTVNNVAHVGHEHPAVVKVGQEQMAMLNTNSRYLHDNINALAQALMETLPHELSVLHFLNSGSEANELAIRMAKAFTGEKDIIVSEVGYHGNTNACVEISSYKFDGKGGMGAPEHTHVFPLPDAFRGKYRGENTGKNYVKEVMHCIKSVQGKGRNPAALIVEPIISCGGQIELPKGFLKKAYEVVRTVGGLCISDEVQTGCGRMGKTFWGFQLHDVVPDIVTMGKPLGNGHPIAAVACTMEVADKFANGMEYFNTFGGNPVSCAIGLEVLKTVKRENLQKNALLVGEFLKSELKLLSQEFPIIGDVRGQGLFLGVEFVDKDCNPLKAQADYLVNRMKDHGILMSTDGLDGNVIKIKPPMVFSKEHAKELLFYLRKILTEDFMNLNYL